MIIPDEDSLELAGRIKTLLPNARYLAMYLRNVADPMNEAFTAGFDGYIVKPFQQSQIEDLVLINSDAPESFDEILMIDENLLQAKPGRGKGEYEEYYSRMAELIGDAIEQLASDCFDDVTIDYTNLPASSLMNMLVSVSLQCCSELGLEARIVGGDEVKAAIQAEEDASAVQVFDTLAEAMASAGWLVTDNQEKKESLTMSDETLDMSIVGVLQRIKKPGFFSNLVQVYEEDSTRILGLIKASIDNADAKALEESAHSLKSASSSISAARVAEVASELEKMGESNSFDGASEQLDELSQRLTVSHSALKALLTEG